MSKIYINFREIREANYVLPYMGSRADRAKKQIEMIKMELPVCLRDKYQIGQRMEQVHRRIGRLESQIDQLHEITNFCVEQYEAAEYENNRNAEMFL